MTAPRRGSKSRRPPARRTTASSRRPGTTTGTQPGEFEAANALPQVLKVVAAVAAPTTILTALLLYFGILYAVGYFRYFGVNFTALNLPPQDYLVLSVDGATIPVAILAIATLLVLWVYRLPLHRLSGRARDLARRVLMPAVAVAGAGLVSLVAADVRFGSIFPTRFWEARGLSLAIGVLLLAYAGRLRRALAPPGPAAQAHHGPEGVVVAKWAAMLLLVSIGLFWAVGSYGIAAGTGAAAGLARALPCASDVILYSEKSLNLQAPGVREEASPLPDSAYRFRYTGLKLVPQSGDHYLFLPAGWVPGDHQAILLKRDGALRLEFVARPECTDSPSSAR